MGNQVIELVRVGWIWPRAAAIVICGIWLFGMGLIAPRVMRRGEYPLGVRVAFAASIPLYLFAAVYAALTL